MVEVAEETKFAAPFIEKIVPGEVVPTPTLPLAKMVIKVEVAVPFVVEEIVNRGVLAGVLTVFEMARREYGEVVPIPTFWFAPKKRDEVATCPPVALNVVT